MKKLLLAISLLSSFSIFAEDEAKITTQKVNGNVYLLQGSGGNIGVLATEQGLLLVDDKFRPLAEKIEAAMKGIVDKPLKYVVNTHYHGDHTGSNSYFGHHAPIFAHENVRSRLDSNEKFDKAGLPVVTYQDGVKIHLANEQVQLTHLPKGHTDGDTIVYFQQSNVLHAGDQFFHQRFPYVDLKGGGSVKGYLANVQYMLKTFPDDVAIIPGHGELTDKAGLKALETMLIDSITLVEKQIAAGKSDQEIIDAGIDEKYKQLSWRFITEERWMKTLVNDLRK